MEPIEDDLCGSVNKSSEADLESYREKALNEISQGHVGVLLLAGGQGTRLGRFLKWQGIFFKKARQIIICLFGKHLLILEDSDWLTN